jgi:glycosyltransferase involved in cell wall biosynthesis
MVESPNISVLVAAHNEERFIGRCLRSLLNQTIPQTSYEVIVINDGSTDRTSYALELFSDELAHSKAFSCIRVLNNKENLGLPASLNRGIRDARAPYIVRVDSEGFLNFLHAYLDQNPHFDAVACDYLKVNDAEEILKRCNSQEEPIACGIMFQKQHLLNVGLYDEDFKLHEDRDLRIRFDKKYTISRLEMPLYRYRQHENNMTNDSEAMKRHEQNLLSKHGLQGVE